MEELGDRQRFLVNEKNGLARFIAVALTKACSRRATRAADAKRWASQSRA